MTSIKPQANKRSAQSHPSPEASKRPQSKARPTEKIFTSANVAIAVSVISIGFTAATYFDQSTANSAQIRVDQATASAFLRHNAERVSYYLGTPARFPRKGAPPLIIANRSLGPLRNMAFNLGSMFVGLPDIPPCSIETTGVMKLTYPKITPQALKGSVLTFTDATGNRWRLTGSGHLLEHAAPTPGESGWTPSANVQRANDCS